MYEGYGWCFCRTITLTEKKVQLKLDVPFLKLSALREVTHGWFRAAAVKINLSKGSEYWIQCTTWQDKKQVMFLHTNTVGVSSALMVKCHVKGEKKSVILQTPASQKDYVKYFSAVDPNDLTSSNYSTSTCTNCWNLQLFFWVLDCVLHVVHVVIIFCANANIGPQWWKWYQETNGDHMKCQIDLGLKLLNFAIRQYWPDPAKTKPQWMQRAPLIPCDCKLCYFCLEKRTNGIQHKPQAKAVTHHLNGKKTLTSSCTTEQGLLDIIPTGAICATWSKMPA